MHGENLKLNLKLCNNMFIGIFSIVPLCVSVD